MKKEELRFEESTVFEGMTSIRAVIRAAESGTNDRRIKRILFDSAKRKKHAREIDWLSYKSHELNFSVEPVGADYLSEVTTGSTHGGIVAECTARTIAPLSVEKITENGFYVMLEGIEDPYNFGYTLRSLYACGVDGIILTPRNWMSAAGVVCRSSAGASELLPMFECEPTEAAAFFKERSYRILCAGIRDSVSSFDANMKKPLFLIVGGEKRGISASLLDLADQIVRIDYGRDFAGSLSTASAATILAYEVLRQNR